MGDRFAGRVALVTGGSSGIGASTALELAKEGASVMITGRGEARLRAAAAKHRGISYIVADVGRIEDAARTIGVARSRHGRLDVLVNNAGIAPTAPLAEASPEHVREVFQTNVIGLIELTRAALPLLRTSRGAIVNVTTAIADEPLAETSVYRASKAAVQALTRAWAQELAADGVRVNAVSPGPIETSLFTPEELGIGPEDLEATGAGALRLLPPKRFGTPEAVAHVVAFLASATGFVTGAQYTVGGRIEA